MSKQSFSSPMRDIRRYIKPYQIDRILEVAGNSGGRKSDRDVLLLLFLKYTGRRIGEILPVKVKDIVMEEQSILFKILKKKRDLRKLKNIHDVLWGNLHLYLERHGIYDPEEYIFKSDFKPDSPITDTRVRQIVYRYCEMGGIPDFEKGKKVHPHTFRHSFAIEAAKKLENPHQLRILQQILEHDSIEMTTNYLQLSNTEQKEVIEKLYPEKNSTH